MFQSGGRFYSKFMMAAGCALLLAGCASTAPEGEVGDAYDPIEPVNRFVFAVNDGVDTLVLNPVSTIYREGVPVPVQSGVRNVLRNLKGPIHVAGALLAGEGESALVETQRFVINSTIGLAGIFDVAADHGLPTTGQDFGRSLGKMGVEEGPYIVLPLLGPSNLRDAVGFGGEIALDPFNYVVRNTGNSDLVYARAGATIVSERAAKDQTIRALKQDAVDYYARTRSAYTQHRRSVIGVEGAAAEAAASEAPPATAAQQPPAQESVMEPQAAPAVSTSTPSAPAQRDLLAAPVRYRSPDDRP